MIYIVFRWSQEVTQGYFPAWRSLIVLFHRRLHVPLLWKAYKYMTLYGAKVLTIGELLDTQLSPCGCISCNGALGGLCSLLVSPSIYVVVSRSHCKTM